MGDRRMRQWIACLIVLTLWLTGCTPFAGDSNDNGEINTEEPETEMVSASEHLLTVWSDYLRVVNEMSSAQIWALDYVDAYLESNDWKDLTKARCACIASAGYLSNLSMTEQDLDAEEYLDLSSMGVDTSYQSIEFSTLGETLDTARQAMKERFLEELEENIVFNSTISILKQESSLQRELISYMMQYTCRMTNYLLVSLKDDTVAEAYWSTMEERFPLLASSASSWIGSETELETAAEACLDNYEKVILQQYELTASMDANLYLLKKIINDNDHEALLASANQMENKPKLLPVPLWYDLSSAEYNGMITTEDSVIAYPKPGEEIADDAYGVSIHYEGVGLGEIEEYIISIENYADSVRKETDGDIWYISMPDYTVEMSWENQQVSILFHGQDVTFVPKWYLEV